jgi:hypothetical protein
VLVDKQPVADRLLNNERALVGELGNLVGLLLGVGTEQVVVDWAEVD